MLVRAAAAALVVGGALLRIINIGNVAARSPDEQVYTAQSRLMLQKGLSGSRTLAKAYLRSPNLVLYPPPTRIGYLFLLAATMRVTGVADERAGAWLSCAASILSLLLALEIGWRFLGPWPAILGLAFLCIFPPELVIARRCWIDALVGFGGLLLFRLTLANPTSFISAALPVAGTSLLLLKESSIVIYAGCLLIAFWKAAGKERVILIGSALLGSVLCCAILAFSVGSLNSVFAIILGLPKANAQNAYALGYMSGPGYLLPLAFLKLSWLTFASALLGMSAVVLIRDSPELVRLALLTAVLIGVFTLIPHGLNLRYVSATFAPLCLFAGAGLWHAFLAAKRILRPWLHRVVTACAAIVVALSLMTDYERFQSKFVRGAANDLAVRLVNTTSR